MTYETTMKTIGDSYMIISGRTPPFIKNEGEYLEFCSMMKEQFAEEKMKAVNLEREIRAANIRIRALRKMNLEIMGEMRKGKKEMVERWQREDLNNANAAEWIDSDGLLDGISSGSDSDIDYTPSAASLAVMAQVAAGIPVGIDAVTAEMEAQDDDDDDITASGVDAMTAIMEAQDDDEE